MTETPGPNLDVLPGTETVQFVCGQPYQKDDYQLAMVFKRACQIAANGQCVLTDEPVPIVGDSLPYDPDVKPPLVSPPSCDSDLLAFKPATDLVVQGHAYAPSRVSALDVELRLGPYVRAVRVFGDRRLEWSGGRAVITPPAAFEKLPLRFDRAYGGVDTVALERDGDEFGRILQKVQPDLADGIAGSTPFHYPRNPAGCGYLMRLDRESVEAARVPNIEFPFDPLTPERMAVGGPGAWVHAPLPAGFDWYHATWFPRFAYIGQVPEHDTLAREVPETAYGWAAPGIMNLSGGRLVFCDLRWLLGAPPGMAIPNLPPNAVITLRYVFPHTPELRVQLPGWLPRVRIAVKPTDVKEARTQLNTVIIQPDKDRVVLVFAAVVGVTRPYGKHEMAEMKWSIE